MDGIIIVGKDSDTTSHDAVSGLRRILHQKKIGHAGTLDPMATGVLPICLGKATRLAEYIGNGTKTYIAGICFGIETDSYDRQGKLLFQNNCENLRYEDILEALEKQKGDIMQIPPMVSALKKNGQPLYKLACEGITVERKPRPVHISEIKAIDFTPGANPILKCLIDCSKGTYIRSIAHDTGEELGCGAHLISLHRSRVGEYTDEQAYSLEQIEAMSGNNDFSFLLPPESALKNAYSYMAQESDIKYLLHGNCRRVDEKDCALCAVYDDAGFIGIGHIKNSVLYMDKVLKEV